MIKIKLWYIFLKEKKNQIKTMVHVCMHSSLKLINKNQINMSIYKHLNKIHIGLSKITFISPILIGPEL